MPHLLSGSKATRNKSPKHSKSFFGLSLGKHTSRESLSHGAHADIKSATVKSKLQAPPTPELTYNSSPSSPAHESSTSKVELKRFFRMGHSSSSSLFRKNPKRTDSSSSLSMMNNENNADEIGENLLMKKYGELGKVLGSGAGGSVRLLHRPSDNTTFAVKQFRPRKSNETPESYAKKCTSEFCIGSSLHHPNIIESLDIIHDHDNYFEVMEYCPVDFFAVVMSGKMSRGEINCCFKQIVLGVQYLHDMGLAHRDLKLDNCVMNEQGILKLIDFGSAVVFRYPYEDEVTLARGIVGSDPYLAPEVLVQSKYDPQPVDIWSIGIIFVCMMLKRFAWKVPNDKDPSFRLFAMPDDEGHDYDQSARDHAELMSKKRQEKQLGMIRVEEKAELRAQVNSPKEDATDIDQKSGENFMEIEPKLSQGTKNTIIEDAHVPAKTGSSTSLKKERDSLVQKNSTQSLLESQRKGSSQSVRAPLQHSASCQRIQQAQKKPVIHGPYRLLRLLPHAARPLLSNILKIDPTQRATLLDFFRDDWFLNISCCTSHATVNICTDHHHTIV